MSRISSLLLILLFIFTSCVKESEVAPEAPKRQINIFVLETNSTKTSITLSLNALGARLEDYDRWGITYNESPEVIHGHTVIASGSPASGKVSVKIDGLQQDTDYHIWGWVEGEGIDRIWTPDHIIIKTADLLQESQELNFKRWKILDYKVHMNFQALGTYEAEVEFVKQYIDDRLELFDQLVRN